MTQPLPAATLTAAALAAAAADIDIDAVIAAGADMSCLHEARLIRALHWWQDLPRMPAASPFGMALPDRAQIDPCAIPDLLPHVVLWQVLHQEDGSFGYRCRLAGTAMVEMHGYEFTGMPMDRFHGEENARIQPEYDFVTRTGRPHYVERSLFWINREHRRYRRLLLPFGDRTAAHGGVAKIMNVAVFLAA